MITFLLANRWARYGLAGIVVLALLLGVRQHYINIGKGKGELSEKRTETTQDEKEAKVAQKTLTDALEEAKKTIKAASERESQAQKLQQSTLAALKAISDQKKAGTEKVNSLTDPQLHAYNLSLLGGEPGGACYSGLQERKIAESLTQLPLCRKEVTGNENSIAAINQRIDALKDTIAGKDKALVAMTQAKHESDVRYTRLRNRYPDVYRSAKCLWIVKCGKRHIDEPVPDPIF